MNPNYVRITVYLHKEEYRKLRSQLALLGISVSEWVRRKMKEFLTKPTE